MPALICQMVCILNPSQHDGAQQQPPVGHVPAGFRMAIEGQGNASSVKVACSRSHAAVVVHYCGTSRECECQLYVM